MGWAAEGWKPPVAPPHPLPTALALEGLVCLANTRQQGESQLPDASKRSDLEELWAASQQKTWERQLCLSRCSAWPVSLAWDRGAGASTRHLTEVGPTLLEPEEPGLGTRSKGKRNARVRGLAFQNVRRGSHRKVRAAFLNRGRGPGGLPGALPSPLSNDVPQSGYILQTSIQTTDCKRRKAGAADGKAQLSAEPHFKETRKTMEQCHSRH